MEQIRDSVAAESKTEKLPYTMHGEKKSKKTNTTDTQDVVSKDIVSWLQQFKCEKDQQIRTHTLMGPPYGSFCVPLSEKPQLIKLLHQTRFIKGQPVHLLETPQEQMPIKVDLDFRYEMTTGHRTYTSQTIKDIVKVYQEVIRSFLNVNDPQLHAYVFERDEPYLFKGTLKDGIHLIFPNIVCHTEIQHLIRNSVIVHPQMSSIVASLGTLNKINDIVDKSVISINGWLMYGCSKPNCEPYQLTQILDINLNPVDFDMNDTLNLITLLSIRDHDASENLPIRPELTHLLKVPQNQKKCSPKEPPKIKIVVKNLHEESDLHDVSQLVELLSKERSDSYSTWIDVGWCLYNISQSQNACDLWESFSKLSMKYDHEECVKQWAHFEKKNFTIASLHYWAKLDNPEKYKKLSLGSVTKLMLACQSQTTYDCAKLLHAIYKYQFISTGKSAWYFYENGLWILSGVGIELRRLISSELLDRFLLLISSLGHQASQLEDGTEEKDKKLQQIKGLSELTLRLRSTTFKDQLMKEAFELFYDREIGSKMDSNPDLINFNNGVYDLRDGSFRDHDPLDYITLSTHINFKQFNIDDPIVLKIEEFLTDLFPNSEVKDYVLLLLASFLEGRNPNEKFHIWTGIGRNGKSKLLEFYGITFGDYMVSPPASYLTDKTKDADAPSEVMMSLRGKRVAAFTEPDEKLTWNASKIKSNTGNDKISCRGLYGMQIEFKPQFKICCACNKIPATTDDSEGMWARMSVLEFVNKFVDDPDPKKPHQKKIKKNLSESFPLWKEAFMFMLLEKYKIYKKQGLVEPKQVIEATGRYHESTDTIQHFIDDNLEKSEDRTHDVYVTFKEIYERYRHSEYFDKTLKQKDIKEMLINKLDHFEKEARVTDRVTKQSCIKKSVFLYHQLTSEIIEQPQKTPIVYELKDN